MPELTKLSRALIPNDARMLIWVAVGAGLFIAVIRFQKTDDGAVPCQCSLVFFRSGARPHTLTYPSLQVGTPVYLLNGEQ